jgi:hypothetical protein
MSIILFEITSSPYHHNNSLGGQAQLLTPLSLATWEAEIENMAVGSQSR